jgi:molybdopterin molybdotransferase
MTTGTPREFFAVRSVADALNGFRPARRTAVEAVALAAARGRVPGDAVLAPHDLPGFARSTVDGYAVRASDTYGASEGLPGYLDVVGAAAMGAVLPPGADAVVMVEHTQQAMAGTVEIVRPVAPGDGIVRADEDARGGAELVPAGRPLRAQDLGLLAAAGVIEVAVHVRPRVAIIATGDEVVDPSTPVLEMGQVRDASTVALAALAREAGGQPLPQGIIADDRPALERALASAVADADVVVVSAGSSVGARDETAAAVQALGPPGIWCRGLAIKPGKPTLLAESDGVPIIGLPGNPRSALVVFRLVGMPIVRRAGGWDVAPAEPVTRARLSRDLASAAGRLDIVQVRVRDGVATPLFGASALLSVLTAADGFVVVDEPATGLAADTEVEVTLYG